MNMAMNNPAVVYRMNINLGHILEDIKNKRYEESDCQRRTFVPQSNIYAGLFIRCHGIALRALELRASATLQPGLKIECKL